MQIRISTNLTFSAGLKTSNELAACFSPILITIHACKYTAISIKVVPKRSGKVEYKRERLMGIAKKIIFYADFVIFLSANYKDLTTFVKIIRFDMNDLRSKSYLKFCVLFFNNSYPEAEFTRC